jgi:transposase, IS30 family
LTFEEREEISRGIAENKSSRVIARRLGRTASVVSREIDRNGGRANYRAHDAAERAETMARRPKRRKLEANRRLHEEVAAGLAQDWSPEQIAGRLRVEHPDDEAMRVSHETIYESLCLQARGELATELKLALRTGRAERAPRANTRPKKARIAGMVNISERPPEAEDRAIPGHWEGDLIIGKGGKSQIATLAERTSRFAKLVRVPYDRTADRVAGRLSTEAARLPEDLRRSLTWDQGVEMAAHAKFTVKTGIPVYFCDPHSPWQRGLNENMNGLLRQYFPKSTDLSGYSQAELDMVADKLNNRPRKVLGWMTPAEKLNELLLNQPGDALTV